jgi:hypothetical protein
MPDTTVVTQYPGITRDNIIGKRLIAIEISGYDRLAGQEFTVDRIYGEPDPGTTANSTNGILPRGRFDDNGRPIDLWVKGWKPVDEPITFETRDRLIGKKIKVISGNMEVHAGEIHTVTSVHHHRESLGTKIDGITVNVDPTHVPGRFEWYVQQYEVVEDEPVTEWVPSVGDRVRITGYLGDRGIIDCVAAEGTVQSVEFGVWMVHSVLYGHQASGPGYVFPLDGTPAEATPDGAALLAAAEQQTVAEMKAEIERLTNRVEVLQKRYNEVDNQFETSIGIIGERMVKEASDRGWCSEFNTIVREVNRLLPSYELVGCDAEYTVEWYDVYEVRVPRSATFTAADAEDAISQAQDDDGADTYGIKDAIDNGGYDWQRGEDYSAEVE